MPIVVKMDAVVLLKSHTDIAAIIILVGDPSTKSDQSSERGYDMDVTVLAGRHCTCLGAAVDKLSLI